MGTMGRPPLYTDDTLVAVDTSANKTRPKLQAVSERRAVVLFVINNGGQAKLSDIDFHFGFDLRGRVAELVREGWLKIVEETDDE